MVFNSYYWHDAVMGEPALAQARDALSRQDTTEPVRPFLTLLASTRVAARGTALDHFQYAEATSRFGFENPFLAHRAEVLDAARTLLADPPVDRGEGGAEIDGANHASALGAMMNLAEPQDGQRIAAIISSGATPDVRELALLCAETILEASPSQPDLTDALRRIVVDDDASDGDRGKSLHLLALADPAEAVSRAVELVRNPSLRLQASAAWLLADLDSDRYGTLLDDVVSRWPDDAPYPAFEVRQLLDR